MGRKAAQGKRKAKATRIAHTGGQIQELRLEHFRGFHAAATARLAPLTIIVGPNSSGKSSLLNALFLLAQSRTTPIDPSGPTFRGELCDLGSFADATSRHRSTGVISIGTTQRLRETSITVKTDQEFRELAIDISISRSSGSSAPVISAETRCFVPSQFGLRSSRSSSGVVKFELLPPIESAIPGELPIHLTSFDPGKLDVYSGTQFIREGVKRYIAGHPGSSESLRLVSALARPSMSMMLPLPRLERVTSARTGPLRYYGSEVRSEIRRHTLYDRVDPSLLPVTIKSRKKTKYSPSQLERALRRLGIADRAIVESLSDYHNALRVRDSVTGIWSNLIDVGFGAAAVIPVLSAVFSPRTSPLALEQPEIHLHPRGQVELGRILCEAVKTRQLLVETHSEHVVNAARLCVAEGRLHCEDVVILYVERARGRTSVTPIGLDERGDFTSEWPHGFFEERFETTMQIASTQQDVSSVASHAE
jgi:hypothetical protein